MKKEKISGLALFEIARRGPFSLMRIPGGMRVSSGGEGAFFIPVREDFWTVKI